MDTITFAPPRARFAQYMLGTATGLCYREKSGIGFWQSTLLDQTGLVRHGFTTRKGGISQGTYASMNLSLTRTRAIEETKQNYALAAHALGIDVNDTVLVNGVHGVGVRQVTHQNRGDGLINDYTKDSEPFDGMVTNEAGVALVTIHADCTPLFIVDTRRRAIGLCHAGWRGTVEGMATQIIHRMHTAFQSDAKDLVCMIGPHIGACCFEVHEDVAQRFEAAFAGFGGVRPAQAPGKYLVDLTLALAYQLFEAGVPAEQVNIAHLCTCCNETLFHSYRRDGKSGGAMASFLQLMDGARGQ